MPHLLKTKSSNFVLLSISNKIKTVKIILKKDFSKRV